MNKKELERELKSIENEMYQKEGLASALSFKILNLENQIKEYEARKEIIFREIKELNYKKTELMLNNSK